MKIEQECDKGGSRLTQAPPPTQVTCPGCGRAVKVEAQKTDGGEIFTIARHSKMAKGFR